MLDDKLREDFEKEFVGGTIGRHYKGGLFWRARLRWKLTKAWNSRLSRVGIPGLVRETLGEEGATRLFHEISDQIIYDDEKLNHATQRYRQLTSDINSGFSNFMTELASELPNENTTPREEPAQPLSVNKEGDLSDIPDGEPLTYLPNLSNEATKNALSIFFSLRSKELNDMGIKDGASVAAFPLKYIDLYCRNQSMNEQSAIDLSVYVSSSLTDMHLTRKDIDGIATAKIHKEVVELAKLSINSHKRTTIPATVLACVLPEYQKTVVDIISPGNTFTTQYFAAMNIEMANIVIHESRMAKHEATYLQFIPLDFRSMIPDSSVYHSGYGVGVIVSRTDSMVEVKFDKQSTLRKLDLRYAALTLV